MQTQRTWPLVDDESERRLRIIRVLLERAADDLEPIEREADGELQTKLSGVSMNLLLALEELPAV